MGQVVLSYAAADRTRALPIIDALRNAGLDVWHAHLIPPGIPFKEHFRRAVETAKCVIILWSEAASQSSFVQQEIRLAIHVWSSDRLVLATLDDAVLPKGLSDISSISILAGDESGVQELVESARLVTLRGDVVGVSASPPIARSEPMYATPERMCAAPARSIGGVLVRVILWAGLALFGVALFYYSIQTASIQDPARPDSIPRPARPPNIVHKPAPQLQAPTEVPALENDLLGHVRDVFLIALAVGVGLGAGTLLIWFTRSRNRPAAAPEAVPVSNPQSEILQPPEVFISYSRRDTSTVDSLVGHIEQLGYAVWIDRQSTGSQRYAGPIVSAIRTSRLVAVMCSQNAFESDHVTREIYVAGDFKKPFIAFQLDSADFPDELLYFLSGFPRIPASSANTPTLGAELSRLIAA